jgi:hypothetical protein
VTRQRFLEPQHIQPFEFPRHGESPLKSPLRMLGEARLDSYLVGIDHDRDLISNSRTDRFDDFDVVAGIGVVEA